MLAEMTTGDSSLKQERRGLGQVLKRAVEVLPINSHLVIDCYKDSSGYGVEIFCDKGSTTLFQDNQKHHSLQISVLVGGIHLCLSTMSE